MCLRALVQLEASKASMSSGSLVVAVQDSKGEFGIFFGHRLGTRRIVVGHVDASWTV